MDADEWINRTAFLSLAETGALLVCVLASWNAAARGDAPGTLPSSPDALSRLLGADAAAVLPIIRQHWTEDPDRPGRLRCAWLAELYAEQLRKHESIVERAKKGGWQKGRARKPAAVPAPASAIPQVFVRQGERDPVGGSFGAPTTGGVVAAVGRGGATATPPPEPLTARAASDDPTPVTFDEVNAWAESQPDLRQAVERDTDLMMDEENKGWRERPTGSGLRNRLVQAKLANAFVRHRRTGSLPDFAPHVPHLATGAMAQ
jgi:hypothetical protein